MADGGGYQGELSSSVTSNDRDIDANSTSALPVNEQTGANSKHF
ncbi:unnamed protein product [Anisakis simplex]|uniref:Uncharacterized protein n=1 Tax=Anisakis simplex TaxID=6269 RepID=A0A0M3JPL4_ANISI|nr:unnamed protein product [Anisakis simplex]